MMNNNSKKATPSWEQMCQELNLPKVIKEQMGNLGISIVTDQWCNQNPEYCRYCLTLKHALPTTKCNKRWPDGVKGEKQ